MKISKVNKCAQFVRQATIVCLREGCLPVCECVSICVCMLGQIASLGLKMSAFEVLGAYGDRRWICCSLDGFTLHNKGFLSFFQFLLPHSVASIPTAVVELLSFGQVRCQIWTPIFCQKKFCHCIFLYIPPVTV